MKINLVSSDQTRILGHAEVPDFSKPPDLIEWGEAPYRRVGYDGKVVVYALSTTYVVTEEVTPGARHLQPLGEAP